MDSATAQLRTAQWFVPARTGVLSATHVVALPGQPDGAEEPAGAADAKFAPADECALAPCGQRFGRGDGFSYCGCHFAR